MAAAATSVFDGSYSTKLGEPYPAARSVHLWWSTPDETPSVFYNEVVVQEHVPGSYFMCAGFSGGYCGIQDNDGQTKTLLFSVWDASDAENDEGATLDDRVQITYEASHVLCKRFGGEGTGAQCIDVTTRWEVGQTVRLMVMQHLEPSGHACYAAWVSSEVAPDWVHLASYRVQKGSRFGGFYSFIEDYRRDGETVNQLRRAQYGPAWSWSESAGWMPASQVSFSASSSERERPDTIDTYPGTEPGTQMLANGGRLKGEAKLKLPPYQLEPGCTPPTLPPGVNPATFFTTEAPTSPEKDPPKIQKPTPVITQCPLCPNKGECAPFCCGDHCGSAQCQGYANWIEDFGLVSPFPGTRCIWKCAEGPLCHFHASQGKKCPLCGAARRPQPKEEEGPFCGGDSCGSSQCQARSPFLPQDRRCDWACAEGAQCAYHANM